MTVIVGSTIDYIHIHTSLYTWILSEWGSTRRKSVVDTLESVVAKVTTHLESVFVNLTKQDDPESVKSLLGRHTKILVKYVVKLETKGDKTENRVLVLTPVRIYLLIAKVPTKIDCHFHYLDIQTIESKNPTHFSITTSERTYSFVTTGDAGNFSSNADVVLTDLASAIKQIFPTVPLKYIIRKIDVQPVERETILSDELRPSDPRNLGPCGSFSLQYACMCDYHGVPYREEVAWDVDTIYLSHDTRTLNLRDFDHLESKDIMAIISALEYNTFFRGLKATHTRLSNESLERILHVLRRSSWLEELHLEALGLRADFLHKLAVSVITNNNPALKNIDLSHNVIEDKGAIHLAGPIAKFSKGLCKLSLAHCGLTAKGVNQIAHSLSLNQTIANSLTYLDLSGNNLKDDINNLYNFLAQPNVLEHLDISATDTTLENLFGALLRGCGTHLSHLNVSHNSFSTKKGKEIPPSFKQFFTSTLSLKHLNISFCKLPMEALKHLLLGLACNESTAGLYLDLSSNSLGASGAHVLESCIHGVRVLNGLDISENNMDVELASVITAISKNPSIRSLHMCRSFSGIKPKHISTVMDAMVAMVQKDDFQLAELHLAENKLRNDIHNFINALGSNQSLQVLDITGNLMGDIGARLLAKALQINNKLRKISLDRNNVTLIGYNDLVYALENNFSMRTIPFPIVDIAPCFKNHPDRTDMLMRKMQEYLQRNGSGLKRNNGQGFRLQHGFLLSATNQLIDKLVSETQETMSLRHGSTDSAVQRLLDDAENSKQLLPKLQEAIRTDLHPIEMRLNKISTEMSYCIKDYLEETMETMLRTGLEQCPKALGTQTVINELRKVCNERLVLPEDFLNSCIVNSAGSEIMNKISEVEQSLASAIADRATDEVVEALTRYRRGLGINDSPLVSYEDTNTPDVLRSRSNQNFKDSMGLMSLDTRGLDLPKLPGLESPTKLEYLNLATPHMPSKRRSMSKKCRPQSVVGLGIENLSLNHIPDLLESPSQRRSHRDRHDENDSITELPSGSVKLQHLVKGRPKKAKTRAPTRAMMCETMGEGIDHFFRTGSVTPTTLTPLVSPTSEECSSLSFVDSPTLSRDDTMGKYGGAGNMTSGETTPILDERKTKLERSSPLLKGVNNWTPRSQSSDNLEKGSPGLGRRSPLVRHQTDINSVTVTAGDDDYLGPPPPLPPKDPSLRSPSNDSIKNHNENNLLPKTGNGLAHKPTLISPKPRRPWSMAGGNNNNSEHKENHSDSNKTTPDGLDNDVVLIEGQAPGGSIVGISPGISLNTTSGGSIVGITPGAALERKSVKDLAAGLSRLGVDLSRPKPYAPKPIYPGGAHPPSSLNSSASSTSSMSASSPTPSPRTSLTSTSSPVTASSPVAVALSSDRTDTTGERNDLNNNDDDVPMVGKRTDVPVRKIAGKKISALFEETLVEGLQRKSFRHSVLREGQYVKEEDSVDV